MISNKFNLLFILIIVSLFFTECKNEKEKKTLLFVGSFTDKKPGKGIYVYDFDDNSGKTELKSVVSDYRNTSFLKLSSNGKYLYSVVDSQMKKNGRVAAFKVDAVDAKIELLNIRDCGGLNPAHLEIDSSGSYLINSNYSDGSLSMFKINSDGSLAENSQVMQFKDSSIIKSRQKSSHIHSASFSPDEKYVFAHDLGADKIRRFNVLVENTSASLQNQKEIKTKLGSGPRHFSFHPNGNFGYLVNELSGKINAYSYTNGNLEFIADYPSYLQKQEIYRTADIHISPDGKFLYASNRGPKEDSISIFSINKTNGTLSLVNHQSTGGEHPRNFAIHPSGKFLIVANMFSNAIVIFRRDETTGKLTKLANKISVRNPSSIQIRTY
ncbi:lactonase family protein [uncultured Polaribacter sp.]|uniref:lactonase family protein n=1 Tax=uncultured Polaribacter sp. TaxID=174711 RepID=UPI00260D53CD|nr:lactonase family protein [uncultured Polaribacter sp.]